MSAWFAATPNASSVPAVTAARRLLVLAIALFLLLVGSLASTSPASAFIYWTQNNVNGIGRANLDGSGVIDNFLPTLAPNEGIAAAGGHIYWANPTIGSIARASVRGGGIDQRFITTVGTSPLAGGSVAVGGGRIYWSWITSSGSDPRSAVGGIGRANIDGSGLQQNFIALGTGLDAATGAVALGGPYLFWVQGYVLVRVMRARLDGTRRSLVLQEDGKGGPGLPTAIAADRFHLYFNSYIGIDRTDLNGGQGLSFWDGYSHDSSALALALGGNQLYWSTWNWPLGVGIGRANVDGTALNPNFITHLATPESHANWIAVDTYGPVTINRLSVSPTSFRAAPNGPSAAVARFGATASYVLDKAENVRFTIAKALPGRIQNGSCAAPTTTNRSAKACTRLIPLTGSFSRSGSKGRNRFRFTGRLGSRKLTLGTYRLIATPIADGSIGSPSNAKFQIDA